MNERQKILIERSFAVARAISQQTGLHYRGQVIYNKAKPLSHLACHINNLILPCEAMNDIVLKGKLDSIALNLDLSDPHIHKNYRPTNPVDILLFDVFEQIRVQSLTPDYFHGLPKHIQANFTHWSLSSYQSGLTESGSGLILFSVIQMVYARLVGYELNPTISEVIEATRANLAPIIGHALVTLKRAKQDQIAYAIEARHLIHQVSKLLANEQKTHKNQHSRKQKFQLKLWNHNTILINERDFDGVANHSFYQNELSAPYHYKVYTRDFDQIRTAQSLVRETLLKTLRQNMDDELNSQKINQKPLTAILSHFAATKYQIKPRYGCEEGYLDSHRLTQVITSGISNNVFFQLNTLTRQTPAISILINCSGSMQKHAGKISLIIDTLLTSAKLTNTPMEIIGFTTVSWSGGLAYKQWQAQGKPSRPGRLNQTRYIVFKSFQDSYHDGRRSIAALRKADLYKESIDGEAVNFACERLNHHSSDKKILLVFSDGGPMDTATAMTNHDDYLDQHLIDSVAEQNTLIFGLGLGVDLSKYYTNNMTIDDKCENTFTLCRSIIKQLKQALTKRKNRHRR